MKKLLFLSFERKNSMTLLFRNTKNGAILEEKMPRDIFIKTKSGVIFEDITDIVLCHEKIIFDCEVGHCKIISSHIENFSFVVGLYCKLVALFNINKGISPLIGKMWWGLADQFGRDSVKLEVISHEKLYIIFGNAYQFMFKGVTIVLEKDFCSFSCSNFGISNAIFSKSIYFLRSTYSKEDFIKDVISFLIESERRVILPGGDLFNLCLRIISNKKLFSG